MKYKVVITTSGIGSRLGKITNYTNKCLVRIGKKPTISHIVDKYPTDLEFVITIGYYGNQVKDYLELVYPKHNFKFVKIDKYKGEGSSLLYSLMQAKSSLQSPFIYHACDTITDDIIPVPDHNWIAGSKNTDSSSYASLSVIGLKVSDIHDKGYMNFDFIHIGLIGIYNYKLFWATAKNILDKNPKDQTLGDVNVLDIMISSTNFKIKKFSSWYDIGSVKGLVNARKKINNNNFYVLDKLAESIYQIDNYFIKFFCDSEISKNRVKREKYMNGTIPKVLDSKENFYKYKLVNGDLFSEYANRSNFLSLLKWAENNLWKPVLNYDPNKFKEDCKRFYYDKTLSRVNDFLLKKNIEDSENIINGEHTPKLSELIKMINFDELCLDQPTNFHGDFILDNIIMTESDNFKLIDWRQDFAGNLEAGDKYYDLAKLAHNLVVNHTIIDQNLFEIKIDNKIRITLNINRHQTLVECEKIYFEYLKSCNYNIKKIKLLRAIIWLNMSPLHHHPFDMFLYYFGKYELSNILINEKF
jgi:thiamine kinase-like enzyme